MSEPRTPSGRPVAAVAVEPPAFPVASAMSRFLSDPNVVWKGFLALALVIYIALSVDSYGIAADAGLICKSPVENCVRVPADVTDSNLLRDMSAVMGAVALFSLTLCVIRAFIYRAGNLPERRRPMVLRRPQVVDVNHLRLMMMDRDFDSNGTVPRFQCSSRCSHAFCWVCAAFASDYEALLALDETIPTQLLYGASSSEVRRLPVYTFEYVHCCRILCGGRAIEDSKSREKSC